jgi:hypothetical protein
MSDILFGKNNSETDARGGGEEDPFFWTDGRKVVVGRRRRPKRIHARTARKEEVLRRVFCDAKAHAKRHTRERKRTKKRQNPKHLVRYFWTLFVGGSLSFGTPTPLVLLHIVQELFRHRSSLQKTNTTTTVGRKRERDERERRVVKKNAFFDDYR